MNTEKVRSALQRAGMLLASQSYHTDYIEEALAELEKPAVHGPIYVPDALEKEVDRISESYHAKKCAECVGNLPAFPHRTEAPHA